MWSEINGKKCRFFERYKDPMTGKNKTASITLEGKDTARNRKLAQQILSDKINESMAAGSVKEKNLTLKELVKVYRKYQKQNVSEATYSRNYFAMESMMNILGEDVLVEKLTANYVKQKFMDHGDSKNTANERIARLRALINWAYINDYVDNVEWIRKLTKYQDNEKRDKLLEKFMEPEELKQLIDGMEHYEWKMMTKFLCLSGLRIGEAIALELKDIDFEKRTITINKTYDGVNKLVTDPKTPASNRDVFMQDELLEVVKEIQLNTKKKMLRMAAGKPRYLFCKMDGSHIDYFAYNKYLRDKTEEIIGRKLTPHALRHTHVALMAPNASIEAIARRLGHEDSKVTKKVYMHVTEKLKEKDNAEFEKVRIL